MLVTKPTALLRWVLSARALALGRYPSCCASASTRSRVSADTRAEPRRPPLSADDAAISDTPAARATSFMVGASRRRDVFGGVVGAGFVFELGTEALEQAVRRARAAAHCSMAFVRGGARRVPMVRCSRR